MIPILVYEYDYWHQKSQRNQRLVYSQYMTIEFYVFGIHEWKNLINYMRQYKCESVYNQWKGHWKIILWKITVYKVVYEKSDTWGIWKKPCIVTFFVVIIEQTLLLCGSWWKSRVPVRCVHSQITLWHSPNLVLRLSGHLL